MNLPEECKQSEQAEIDTYFRMSRQLYENSVIACDEVYDITSALTHGFSVFHSDHVLADSRIIKILRYLTVPSLSQMKLGQLVGISTTGAFENSKLTAGAIFKELQRSAPRIIDVVTTHLDRQRFLWHQVSLDETQRKLAEDYAKKWTCSLIGDQNAATAFRNWRKDMQEKAVANAISKAGYTEVDTRSPIRSLTDLSPGQYSRECRVQGKSVQKADFAVRLRISRKLFLLEAKAIGVRLDAYKRVKECRNKADEWKLHFGSDFVFGAVLAGFVPESEVASINSSDNLVFWEHDLSRLTTFVHEN